MAYNFSKGRQIVGDLSGSDDSGRDTGIDFENDYIGLQTGGATNFVLSGSKNLKVNHLEIALLLDPLSNLQA